MSGRSGGGPTGGARLALVLAAAVATLAALALLLPRDGERDAPRGALAPDAPAGARPDGPAAAIRAGEAVLDAAASSRASAAPEQREDLAPARAAAEADERPPALLRGRVLAAVTERPLEDARVVLAAGELVAEARSDAAGRFELEWRAGLPATCAVEREGYAPQRRARVLPSEELVVRLAPCGAILGLVIGPGPDDLARSRAYLWDLRGRPERQEPVEARVDGGGAFRFEGLAPGDYSVGAATPGRGMVFEHELAVGEGERAQVTLELLTGATLRGRVLLAGTTEGVPGVEVRARPTWQGVWRDAERLGAVEAVSDADGAFRLEGLCLGRNRIRYEAPWGGRGDAVVEVRSAGEALERDLELSRPAGLSGRVVRAEGGPAAGAVVQVAWEERPLYVELGDEPDARRDGLREARADAQGRFAFDELPAGAALRLVALDAELAGRDVADALGWQGGLRLARGEERTGVELTLVATERVAGTLTNPRGEPVVGARVRAERTLGRRDRVDWSQARSDEQGRFELRGLLPGPYELRVSHDEHFPLILQLRVEPGGVDALDLRLAPAAELSGLVLGPEGEAVPYASVRASAPEIEDQRGRPRTRSTHADAFGRFRLGRLDDARWIVSAHARGYRMDGEPPWVELPEEAWVVLEMQPERELERAVVRGRALLDDGGVPEWLRVQGARGAALTAESGSFRLSGVRPGELTLTLRARNGLPARVGPVDVAPGSDLDLGLVELRTGERLVVRLWNDERRRVRDARVVLRALPPEQGGAADVPGRLRPDRDDSAGRHVFDVVPPGAWQLVVEHEDFRRLRERVTIERGAERELDLTLRRAAK